MDDRTRKSLLEAVSEVRARTHSAWSDEPAARGTQPWVEKRRLLFVEDAIACIETAMSEEGVDTRALAEALYALLSRAHEIAPGQGLETAAEAVLEALAQGDPRAPPAH